MTSGLRISSQVKAQNKFWLPYTDNFTHRKLRGCLAAEVRKDAPDLLVSSELRLWYFYYFLAFTHTTLNGGGVMSSPRYQGPGYWGGLLWWIGKFPNMLQLT